MHSSWVRWRLRPGNPLLCLVILIPPKDRSNTDLHLFHVVHIWQGLKTRGKEGCNTWCDTLYWSRLRLNHVLRHIWLVSSGPAYVKLVRAEHICPSQPSVMKCWVCDVKTRLWSIIEDRNQRDRITSLGWDVLSIYNTGNLGHWGTHSRPQQCVMSVIHSSEINSSPGWHVSRPP